MNAQSTLTIFFALCFIIMVFKYRAERKRYESLKKNFRYLEREFRTLFNKHK